VLFSNESDFCDFVLPVRQKEQLPNWVLGSFRACTFYHVPVVRGRDSSVGIVTRFGLDGPGIEPQWGQDFPHLYRTALGFHPPSYTMGTGSFSGVNWLGHGVDYPSCLVLRLKKE
jgi:hypothetical protein